MRVYTVLLYMQTNITMRIYYACVPKIYNTNALKQCIKLLNTLIKKF